MSRTARRSLMAALSLLWCGGAASAETLRCQSINGNVNCAGSDGVSCQTINGHKTCVSGNGAVVQSFGGGSQAGPEDLANRPNRDEMIQRLWQRHAGEVPRGGPPRAPNAGSDDEE